MDLMPEAPYQIGSLTIVWKDARDRPAVLRYDQPVGVKLVQQRQTPFPELRGSNPLHHSLLSGYISYYWTHNISILR